MPDSRRAALRTLAMAAAVAVAIPGCGLFREIGVGGDDPQWVEKRYRSVNSATVLDLANSVVAGRFPPHEYDVYRGVLQTGWAYGRYAESSHQALRARVRVETEAEDDVVLVRLRVQQETSEKAGRVMNADPGDWEIYDDDVGEARRLLMKLHILLRDVAEPVADPEAEKSGP